MVRAMRRLHAALGLSILTWAAAPAAPAERVTVPAMRTSIYVGSVALATTPFDRTGDEYRATYEAKVRPWFFWSESGRITIKLPAAAFARLRAGETVEFTGEAFNHRHKPRKVSGRAQPAGPGADTGRIKVRIGVDDTELIFNGTYTLGAVPPDQAATALTATGAGDRGRRRAGDR